ncbi:phage antirepressor [Paenibacillus spongiae]|uniref:Phage antirepressor n=1 Tax=Paenibacillus spongiae TaxID=2909671 RepID=A0ABY5SBN6_9BACL|nr:phage antirepressor [Paenibacillus spongiae]UVI31174.1 phage antirepressor [Paenibacillus spongiae]
MQLFQFEGNQLRTVDKDGEPWFVLKDACGVLDLAHRVVRQRLSDDVCSTYAIPDSLGRPQDTTIINEDGLYDVILESRKPEAKAFRKWITSEVIPSIRKHGAYMTPETIEKTLFDPDYIIKLATHLKAESARADAAQLQLDMQRPMVVFAESLQVSEDSILVGELAKLLKQNGIDIGGTRLFRILREEGYLMGRGEQYNLPTQRSMDLGIMEIKVGTRMGSDGTSKPTRTPKITGKGQIYFVNKFKNKEGTA